MQKPSIKIFDTSQKLAYGFIEFLISDIAETLTEKESYFVALSGGSTPKIIFKILGEEYSNKIPWKHVHFYWSDERCVPPYQPDSNYGVVKHLLFDKIQIPDSNIHRIKGESNPPQESIRYAEEILKISIGNSLPKFNLIMLGIGDDGHTASLFPNQMELLNSQKLCEVVRHPVSKQLRITLTLKLINNAEKVIFLVTDNKKSGKIYEIINHSGNYERYPAYFVNPSSKKLYWFLDSQAATNLLDGSR